MKRQKPKSKQTESQIQKKPEPEETTEKFDPNPFMKKGVNDQEIISMKECFDIFDKDKSGFIDLMEMKNLIEELSLETNPDKIIELTQNIDYDNNHKIDFQEFLNLLSFYDFDYENEEQLNKIFGKFSESKEAFTIEDLRRMADFAGESFTETQYENMIKFGDRDGDNAINFDEFKNVIMKEQKKLK